MSIEDLAARSALKHDELQALAEAGALDPLVAGRREAMWKVQAPRAPTGSLLAGVDLGDAMPRLPPLTPAAQLLLDYERTGLSVTDHPMRLVRPNLPRSIRSAADLASIAHGRRVTTAGMVICRQRPGTASGVVFITMEDETAFINLILYSRVFDKFRHVATTSSLLIAHGKIERDGDVLYVVTERLEPLERRSFPGMSRDFH